MKMKAKGWIIAAAFLLCACSGGGQSEPLVRSVYVMQPIALSKEIVKTYPGVVKATHEINLGFKTPGQIERIHVKEGDYVHRGQLLAELDDADYKLAVEALQIQYDQVSDEVGRTAQLFQQKSISANDYEKASAGLKQLGVQLQIDKNKLKNTKLYAPADGYVQAVNFSPAEMVDAGTAVFNLLDISRMEIEADIPIGTYQQRNNFRQFRCHAAGIGENIQMALFSLTSKADGNQLYQLRLTFAEQPEKRMTAGMNIEVDITIADTAVANGFSVPLSAVFRDGDTPCIWALGADSTIVKRPVILGNTISEGYAVILKGLTGKEQIIRAGVNVLQQGEKVRVIGKPSKTNIGELL